MDENVIKKFWESVEKTDYCWNWTGPLKQNGLPKIVISYPKQKEYSSRRISKIIHNQITNNRIFPLICNNRLCVNPEHLVSGNEDRFWSKVYKPSNKEDCWIWYGYLNKDMYGVYSITENKNEKKILAHIYSWELFTGIAVPPNRVICHKCDHPYCVNPYHLSYGTQIDNIKDRDQKGRQSRGSKRPTAKIDENQVREIRKQYKNGNVTQVELGKIFNISLTTINGIINLKSWKHV